MQTIFLARINSDTTEGRGVQVPFAAFHYKEHAELAANSKEPYGHKNQFCDVKEIVMYGSFEDYQQSNDRDTKIQKALSKLTDQEKQLLFGKTGLPQ